MWNGETVKFTIVAIVMWAVWMLVYVGVIATVLWVGWHFVTKFW